MYTVRPGTVDNCTFQTITKNTQLLEIRCSAGYNGGLSQRFHLEINRQNRTIANLSVEETPQFHIDLSKFIEEWHSDLQFVIYASNAKGRSDSTVFDNQLPKDLRTKIGKYIICCYFSLSFFLSEQQKPAINTELFAL